MNVLCRALFCAILVTLGCGSTPAPSPDATLAPTLTLSPAPALSQADLATSHNTFGIDLWRTLASDGAPTNFALSPASLAVAFSMTAAGAAGDTLGDMRKVLHLTAPDAAVHAATGQLIAAWNAPDQPFTLRVANRLFGEATLPFAAPFLTQMRDAYGAPLEPVSFIGAADAARVRINDWVATTTEDKIKDLLPPAALNADTRLVLTNAIYFKGQWASRFDAARTKDAAFHAHDDVVQVPTMHQLGTFDFARLPDATVLSLPYVGGSLAMTVVLPNDTTLAALEADLSPATLARWTAAMHASEVAVSLPRFRIATDSVSLAGALAKLGMGRAFGSDADFSGMTQADDLFIADAFHKVFVEVNEEGTEAAAATAVVMARESARRTPEFIADRPFLFFVRNVASGEILFMGRVVNPNT